MTIQEILSELRIEYRESGEHHHTRPGWIQIRHCPFCSSDNYHLGWNLQGRFFNCWRCGGHYAPKVFEALGLPRNKSKALLPHLESPKEQEHVQYRSSLLEPKEKGPLGNLHQLYLLRRGFSNIHKLVELWKIEGIGRVGRLRWRLYIPIIHRGQRVSWTTRAIGDKVEQRYISASAKEEVMNHKHLIYGRDFCRHSIVICEGPLDAWKIGPGAGALFGTAFTTAQINLLTSIPRRFVCFDSSAEAQRKAKELASQLSCFPGITENLLIDAKDPGEASVKELRLIRKAARL